MDQQPAWTTELVLGEARLHKNKVLEKQKEAQ